MPVVIPNDQPFAEDVAEDIRAIITAEGRHNAQVDIDPSGQLSLDCRPVMPTQETLLALCAGPWRTDVLVYAIDETFVLPGGGTITNSGGETQVGWNRGAVVSVTIFYDRSDCDGNGYYVYDDSGNRVPMTRTLLLHHEFQHALAALADPESPQEEYGPIQGENALRHELGVPLRALDDHRGGCRS